MGMFAVACLGCDEMVQGYEAQHDDYSKIMVQVSFISSHALTRNYLLTSMVP